MLMSRCPFVRVRKKHRRMRKKPPRQKKLAKKVRRLCAFSKTTSSYCRTLASLPQRLRYSFLPWCVPEIFILNINFRLLFCFLDAAVNVIGRSVGREDLKRFLPCVDKVV